MKHKPNLKINTSDLDKDSSDAKEVYLETDKYSITPTTFKERAFKSSIKDETFRDSYAFEKDGITKSQVTRFGINILYTSLKDNIAKHNKQLKQLLQDNDEKCSNISGETNYTKFAP